MIYARTKRWLKQRLGTDSTAWRLLLAVGKVVNLPKGLYRRLKRDSTFQFESEMDMCSLLPESLLERTLERFRPATVLDLGCGTGRSLDYFVDHGVDATGIENSARAIEHARHPERIVRANLNSPIDLGRRFDLVWSYEVVEHIHPDFVETLLDTFSRHGDVVVLSAARPGQGGQGHFNEQPPSYWIARFAERGYAHDAEFTRVLHEAGDEFSENMLVFVRDPAART